MRPRRFLKRYATYHITARANRGEFILEHDEFKSLFLEITMIIKKRYKFKLFNFCVMNNHIHFLIRPRRSKELPKIMQDLLSIFAIRYNKATKQKGHVWYDRYHSVIVEDNAYFDKCMNYIDLNPVKGGLVMKNKIYLFGRFSKWYKNMLDDFCGDGGFKKPGIIEYA